MERIDNDGNYEPENVKWATTMEQGANKRNNRIIEFNGERMHLAEAARRYQISEAAIRVRVDKFGWSIERALTEPTRPGRRK